MVREAINKVRIFLRFLYNALDDTSGLKDDCFPAEDNLKCGWKP